ncbi:MAG: hypothetical protein F4Y75_07235 [Acidimicrobiia bacterium]|nr:hypothetical protein [Acidimicrobiia bacterium]MYF26540.1 hypothetical protein [Acidimicrobiia bacterium]
MTDFLHLVRRFWEVTLASRLSPSEQAEVAELLKHGEEANLFWDQPPPDQRHGLVAARTVKGARPQRDDLARSALLHDIGKRHARLGPIGRSLATLLGQFGWTPSTRYATYLDHGPIAARELEEAGAEPLVVEYARHHHGERPNLISPEDWELLQTADRASS